MPSTKKRDPDRKKLETKYILDFKRKSVLEIKRLEQDLLAEMARFMNMVDVEFSKVPSVMRKLQLSELCKVLNDESSSSEEEEEVEDVEDADDHEISLAPGEHSSDNGYGTDKTATTINSYTSNLMKSTTKGGSKFAMKKRQQNLLVPNIYCHTPKDKVSNKLVVKPITPKVCSNYPVNILREPRCGETVVSMTGSPILASKSVLLEERMANLMLPLTNGDFISVLPTGNLRKSLLPTLDSEVVKQLKTLKEHIEKFIPKEDKENQNK